VLQAPTVQMKNQARDNARFSSGGWDNNVKTRLALADEKMLDLYGDSNVIHLQTAKSDHYAILIQLRTLFIINGICSS
jgi:hypothetical protein